jgi:hypothetical protein
MWISEPGPAKTKVVNTSGCIAKGPHEISWAMHAADGAVGSVIIYDGVNAEGHVRMRFHALGDTTFGMPTGCKVLCETGIYVEVENATDFATVAYKPCRWTDDPPEGWKY